MQSIQIGGKQPAYDSANLNYYKIMKNGTEMIKEKIALLISILSVTLAILGFFFLLLG